MGVKIFKHGQHELRTRARQNAGGLGRPEKASGVEAEAKRDGQLRRAPRIAAAKRAHRHPRGKKVRQARFNHRSEEHTSELQSLMRISYAVLCLKKKKQKTTNRE